MQPDAYDRFITSLQTTLEADPHVLALVALGSTADPARRDQWSDHDFWVITAPGAAPRLLDDLAWLPNSDAIALTMRHGAHYYTVLFEDSHLIEFAVFDSEQFHQGKLDRYAVRFDRGAITPMLEALAIRTREGLQEKPDDLWRFGNFVTALQVAVQREWRGERLSAHRYLFEFALSDLLALLASHTEPTPSLGADHFDVRRHFERRYPELGAKLDALLTLPIPQAALGLLALAERHLRHHLPDAPWALTATLATTIQREGRRELDNTTRH